MRINLSDWFTHSRSCNESACAETIAATVDYQTWGFNSGSSSQRLSHHCRCCGQLGVCDSVLRALKAAAGVADIVDGMTEKAAPCFTSLLAEA
ncbi:hypothetical protein [Alcanivorax sp.]|uniref:hypothetical protein n=1 Tax=Alcanivorax sp. TaxID=1872427 RepID=UPI0025B7FE85|nr:hypothetical protein [Alcanivorax sp.]